MTIVSDTGTGEYGILYSLPQVQDQTKRMVRRFETAEERDRFLSRNAVQVHDYRDPKKEIDFTPDNIINWNAGGTHT